MDRNTRMNLKPGRNGQGILTLAWKVGTESPGETSSPKRAYLSTNARQGMLGRQEKLTGKCRPEGRSLWVHRSMAEA